MFTISLWLEGCVFCIKKLIKIKIFGQSYLNLPIFSEKKLTIPTILPKASNRSENSFNSYKILNNYVPFLYGRLPNLYEALYR